MRTPLAAALLTLALLGTAACGDDPDDPDDQQPVATDPTSSATAPADPEPSGTATVDPGDPGPSDPAFPADTKPDDGGYGEGGPRWVTGVRVARHEGFDRVVFDLDGPGDPGWYVRYIKEPRQDGSGDPVAVQGDTYLQVVLRGMGYPGFDGIPEIDLGTTPGAGSVTEVVTASVFEGDHLLFVGLDGGKRPFRVFSLSDPTRVVVDVRE